MAHVAEGRQKYANMAKELLTAAPPERKAPE